MKLLQSPVFVVGILFFIGTANVIGNVFRLNWTLGFYDNALHFLGGLWITAFFFYILKNRSSFFIRNENKFILFLFGISFAMFIAVGWEIFEFVVFEKIFHITDAYTVRQSGLEDTIYDLSMGLLGSTLYSFLFLKTRK